MADPGQADVERPLPHDPRQAQRSRPRPAHVAVFEASTAPGGVNAHIGATKVVSAQIVRQSTNETLASYKRAAQEET